MESMGEGDASPSPLVHAGVQGRDRRTVPTWRPLGRSGRQGFDLTETAVRDRVKQADDDAGERDGLTSSEREEPAALRRENRRLREDVEILGRATAFFVKETR